jgi:hypothetical protein
MSWAILRAGQGFCKLTPLEFGVFSSWLNWGWLWRKKITAEVKSLSSHLWLHAFNLKDAADTDLDHLAKAV